MTSPRALFLDAGGTLFIERRPRPAIYATVARAHGGHGSKEDAADLMSRAYGTMPQSIEGHFRFSIEWFRHFHESVLGDLEVSSARRESAHEELVQRFENPKTYRLFKEIPTVLAALTEAGISIGIISNWSERLPVLLDGLGIGEFISFVVTSAEMKVEKPERAVFERALFRAGVPASEAIHAGDHLQRDVAGALGAGLNAVHIDRSAESEGSTEEGVPVLTDLRGILALVEQHCHASRS